ncbi:MAG: LEA type 2 family protein [Candidatus Aminicenantaceae bacterium]
MRRLCILLLLLGFLPVRAFSLALKDDITILLRERQVQNLDNTGLNLVFYIRIKNSSSKAYYLSGYSYRFVVDQTEYLRLQTSLDSRLRLEPSEETLIALPVKITYEHLFRTIEGVQAKDKALCYIMGELAFADEKKERGRLPFSFSGEFPIYSNPQVDLVALNVNMLTIGGSDLNLEIKLINTNGFELLIQRVSYRIKVGNHPIGDGIISGDKSIPAYGEKTFQLPKLLNFFEVGKDVYAFLQQDTAPCQFSGEIEIQTVWGRLMLPFDVSKDTVINKPSS